MDLLHTVTEHPRLNMTGPQRHKSMPGGWVTQVPHLLHGQKMALLQTT